MKTIGKKGRVLLLVLCCMILSLMPALSGFDSILSISPESVITQPDAKFTIQINISGSDIYGVQFDIYFNQTILGAVSVTEENFLKQNCATYSIPHINNTVGKIKFAETCTGETGVSGSGILYNITFKTKSAGSSTLDFDNVKILNTELQQIYVSFINGTVDVVDCDVNHDGILIRDYSDLIGAYKCFLGIERNCNPINYQDWNLMKREYNCFIWFF